jgi:tetratricopeptide (TPR) repeat protein
MQKLLLLALFFAAPLRAQLNPPAVLKVAGMESVEVRKNIAYDGERKLDLYRPKGAQKNLPVVIFLNGVARPELKEWGQYTSWPRLVATRGLAAIAHETSGDDVSKQADALLRYVKAHANELGVDPNRIAIWACSANVRLGTALLASRGDEFRAAVFYYGLMETAPKNVDTPVYVTRAGLDAPGLNATIDRWVAQALTIEAPVTLVNFPEGVHGIDLETDMPESKQIITQTLDFLQFHLTNTPTPRKEPITLSQLQQLMTDEGIARGLARLKELQQTHPDAYVLQERTLNTLGYTLLTQQKHAEAVGILEYAAAAYPESPNAHDSLGDAYEAAGRPADAIAATERALQLLDKATAPQSEGIRRSAEEKLSRLKK